MPIGDYAGTITSGQRTTAASAAARKKVQWQERVNVSADVAPLYLALTKLGKSKTVNAPTYVHEETDWLPTTVTIDGTGYNSSVTTIGVATGHANRLTVGTLLKNLLTSEVLRVTVITSDSNITVVRGVGGTSGAALAANAEISILSFADTEGNTSPSGLSSEPTTKTNACQTFRQALELSGRDMELDTYGDSDYKRSQTDAAEAIMQKVEKQFLFSNAVSTSDPTITGGCEYYITTNLYDGAGSVLTETALIDSIITPWFRRNNSKKMMMAFCGEKFLRAVDSFGRDNIRYATSDTGIGISVMKYRCNFGEIEFVRHGLMTPLGSGLGSSSYGWQGHFIGLNLELCGKRVYGGRSMKLLKNRQSPDKDGIKEEYLTDEGFILMSEQNHVIAKRLG
jgi:hypothetical protein